LQDSFPNDTEIAAENIESLFVHGRVLDVEMFGFKACFFEVVKGLDEAFIVGGVRGERKVLFASNGFGGDTTSAPVGTSN